MRATPDSTSAGPERLIADLKRQLAECQAERDEALGECDKAQRPILAEPHVSLRYSCSPLYQDSPFRPIIACWEQAAGFAHGDGSQEKLRKPEVMLLPGGI